MNPCTHSTDMRRLNYTSADSRGETLCYVHSIKAHKEGLGSLGKVWENIIIYLSGKYN